MADSKYRGLLVNPPKLKVVKGAREVVLRVISCMCDNEYTLKLKKNDDGDFRLSGGMFSLRNFQFKHPVDDIEWSADAQEWDEVFKMINSGTIKIESVKSR